jgi:hypothetical protein
MGRIRERRRAAKVPRPADCSQDVDRHCESNLAPPARRAARSFVHPGATPPGAVARDHGLACRSPGSQVMVCNRLPRGSQTPSGIMAAGSLLTVAGAAAAVRVRCARTAFPFDPSREPPSGKRQAASGKNGVGAKLNQRVVKPSSSISRDMWRGEHKASKWPRPFLNFFTMRGQSFLDSVVCHFAGTQAS